MVRQKRMKHELEESKKELEDLKSQRNEHDTKQISTDDADCTMDTKYQS